MRGQPKLRATSVSSRSAARRARLLAGEIDDRGAAPSPRITGDVAARRDGVHPAEVQVALGPLVHRQTGRQRLEQRRLPAGFDLETGPVPVEARVLDRL